MGCLPLSAHFLPRCAQRRTVTCGAGVAQQHAGIVDNSQQCSMQRWGEAAPHKLPMASPACCADNSIVSTLQCWMYAQRRRLQDSQRPNLTAPSTDMHCKAWHISSTPPRADRWCCNTGAVHPMGALVRQCCRAWRRPLPAMSRACVARQASGGRHRACAAMAGGLSALVAQLLRAQSRRGGCP